MTCISDHNGWKRKKNCNTMCSEQVKIDLNILEEQRKRNKNFRNINILVATFRKGSTHVFFSK